MMNRPIISQFATVLSLFILLGCGEDKKNCDSDKKESDAKKCASAPNGANPNDRLVEKFFLKGSITSAFEVTVDGAKYSEMESFYTAESAKLPEKVKAAGHDGYEVKFDAQIGFNTLVLGMVVFVQSAGERGYSAKGLVGADGNFSIEMPAEAANDTYKVRANKRVGVVLTKGGETKRFCYNFSAVDFQVSYGDKDKPIVLNNFSSTVTTYECSPDPNQGLGLPTAPDGGTSTPTNETAESGAQSGWLSVGTTLKEIEKRLGNFWTATDSEYDFYPIVQLRRLNAPSICAAERCGILVGDLDLEEQRVYWHEGIRPDVLKNPSEWPSTRSEAVARAILNSAVGQKELAYIGAMQSITPEVPKWKMFTTPGGQVLLRSVDKSIIRETERRPLDNEPNNNEVSLATYIGGYPFVVLKSSQAFSVGSYVTWGCSDADSEAVGADAGHLSTLSRIEVAPDPRTALVSIPHVATATSSCDGTIDIFYLGDQIWASVDGADKAVRSDDLYYNYIVKADGAICWDSASKSATFAWISAGGPTIVCQK